MSLKSRTFAPDFALTASERYNGEKLQKMVMLRISHLRRKCKNY